jgi:hypothetical protein
MENNSSNYSPSSFFNIFKQPNCTLRFALHWLMSQRQERQMVWQMWLLCMPPRPGNLTCADWIFLSAEAFACPVLAVLTCSCLHVASSSTPLRFGAVKANLFFYQFGTNYWSRTSPLFLPLSTWNCWAHTCVLIAEALSPYSLFCLPTTCTTNRPINWRWPGEMNCWLANLHSSLLASDYLQNKILVLAPSSQTKRMVFSTWSLQTKLWKVIYFY